MSKFLKMQNDNDRVDNKIDRNGNTEVKNKNNDDNSIDQNDYQSVEVIDDGVEHIDAPNGGRHHLRLGDK